MIQTIIIFTILNGVDITAEYIFSAYNDILSVSKLCSTVDMPLYVRSLRFIKLIISDPLWINHPFAAFCRN